MSKAIKSPKESFFSIEESIRFVSHTLPNSYSLSAKPQRVAVKNLAPSQIEQDRSKVITVIPIDKWIFQQHPEIDNLLQILPPLSAFNFRSFFASKRDSQLFGDFVLQSPKVANEPVAHLNIVSSAKNHKMPPFEQLSTIMTAELAENEMVHKTI